MYIAAAKPIGGGLGSQADPCATRPRTRRRKPSPCFIGGVDVQRPLLQPKVGSSVAGPEPGSSDPDEKALRSGRREETGISGAENWGTQPAKRVLSALSRSHQVSYVYPGAWPGLRMACSLPEDVSFLFCSQCGPCRDQTLNKEFKLRCPTAVGCSVC